MGIGDSNMIAGSIYNQYNTFKNILNNNITLETIGAFTYFGYNHSAVSGFGFFRMLHHSSSPFVIDNVFNILETFEYYSWDTPDIIYIRMGINDFFKYADTGITEAELNNEMSYVNTVIDAFLDYDPNLKVVLGLPSICSSEKAKWDVNFNGTIYENKHDMYIQIMHQFYEKLINNYGEGRYDPRVFVGYDAFYINRSNYVDVLHLQDSTGDVNLGNGFTNTINKLLQ